MYKLARFIFTIYCYIFNRFTVIGRENEPKEGAVVLYCNHQSIFDIFALNIAVKRQIYFMAKKSLFSVPIIGWVVKKYGAFPVDRDKPDISAIKNALKILKDNRVLGIFPEGTRVRNGKPAENKAGFSVLAEKSGALLLPVRIIYKRYFFLFNNIKIIIGKPFPLSDISPSQKPDTGETSNILMNHLYSLGNR